MPDRTKADPGIDYRSELGNFVYAAADGIISYPARMVGISDAAAYHVLELDPTDHPDYRVYYLHLETYYDPTQPAQQVTDPFRSPDCPAAVTLPLPPNTPVKAGCLIALSGKQGTGVAHLHFEVQRVIPSAQVSNVHHARANAVCKDKPGYVCLPVDPYGWTGLGNDPYQELTGISNPASLWRQ